MASYTPAHPHDFTKSLNKNPQRFAYTGHEFDRETDLYYAKARYYDATIGRFNRQDPLLGNIDNPPSLHRYAYVGNRPTRLVDPLGLFEWDPSLGGGRSDEELKQEARDAGDRNVRVRINQQLEGRERVRKALAEGDLSDRASEAYGAEGENPEIDEVPLGDARLRIRRGVFIGMGDTGRAAGSSTWRRNNDDSFTGLDDDGNVRVDYAVDVTIAPRTTRDKEGLADVLEQEGSHTADYNDFGAGVVREQRDGVTLDPVLDLRKYETERRAYRGDVERVRRRHEARRAQERMSDRGATVFGRQQRRDVLEVDGHVLWDSSWDGDEQADKTDAAIDALLAEPTPPEGQGLYGVTPQSPGPHLSGKAGTPIEEEP